MTERENLLKAFRRDGPDHVPFYFDLCDLLNKMFKEKTGAEDHAEYFNMSFRYVDILPSMHPADYTGYFSGLPANAYIDEWGVGHVPGSVGHFARMIHPMESFTEPEQVKDLPLPDVLADYRWNGFSESVLRLKARGLAAVYSAVQIFEPAWYLRGLDNLLMDMMTDPVMAKACLDRMAVIKTDLSRRAALRGVDIIMFGDDVGTQKGMMMHPQLWRDWLKPLMRDAIKAAKDVDPYLIAAYHSDGVIYDIIPDLIEIGVDVLNPVQPECMDPVKIKEMYGDRLSFWGTIGTQTTMPFGKPEDVEKDVRHMIETVGKDGGLLISPTHLLEPEVPWENIIALVDALRKYGVYEYKRKRI